MTEPCICCEGVGNLGCDDCPLCDGLAHFVDFSKLPDDTPDFMIDFYQESPIDPLFFSLTDDEKKNYLDDKLDEYFLDYFDSVSTTGSGSISDISSPQIEED